MRVESSFIVVRDLILVQATLIGPSDGVIAWLVVDTGAVLTTLTPEIVADLGFTADDQIEPSVVHSAVGEERGYIVALSNLTTLGVTLSGVRANVADLGYDVHGVLGMNVLSQFDFCVRWKDRRIIVEKT